MPRNNATYTVAKTILRFISDLSCSFVKKWWQLPAVPSARIVTIGADIVAATRPKQEIWLCARRGFRDAFINRLGAARKRLPKYPDILRRLMQHRISHAGFVQ